MKEQVKLSIFYPHAPEKVWQALTDCRILSTWMMENDFEPHLGHKFKFASNFIAGIKTIIHCEVVEIDKPKRLVYTWQDNVTSEPSLVIWTLTPIDGGTQLQLKHQQTGYAATVVIGNTEGFGQINTHPGLFLYQETRLNCDRYISQISLRQQTRRDELNSLLNSKDSKVEWNYRLEHKLTQALRRYC